MITLNVFLHVPLVKRDSVYTHVYHVYMYIYKYVLCSLHGLYMLVDC